MVVGERAKSSKHRDEKAGLESGKPTNRSEVASTLTATRNFPPEFQFLDPRGLYRPIFFRCFKHTEQVEAIGRRDTPQHFTASFLPILIAHNGS